MRRGWIFLVACLLLAACNGNKFSVDGTIEGGGDSTVMVLELASNGDWSTLDTVSVKGDGTFSVRYEAPEYPSIYRLRIGNQAVCFPIDSLDHITLTAKLQDFATGYTLAGSEHAQQVMAIDKEAIALSGGRATPEQMAAFKRKVSETIVADPASIVAFYAINKSIDGRPLFDPLNNDDLRIVGAVANAFYSFRANDPRTNYLVGVLRDGQYRRHANAAANDTIFADEASLIDIKLQDYDGHEHTLSEVAAKHPMVVLSFTIYGEDFSPVYNKILNDIYTKYRSKGLEIYQIALDDDPVSWRQSAKNLPWITVYEPNGPDAVEVGAYMVTGVPSTFVISHGEIVDRVDNPSLLQGAVSRHL